MAGVKKFILHYRCRACQARFTRSFEAPTTQGMIILLKAGIDQYIHQPCDVWKDSHSFGIADLCGVQAITDE